MLLEERFKMPENIIGYDLADYDKVTQAIREFINSYPDLQGDVIEFATLGEESGVAMFPTNSAAIISEMESITGHVKQVCSYPFFVLYRAGGLSQNRKANIKEWLDQFASWLEKQPVLINGYVEQVKEYPKLTGNRKITKIQRGSPAYLDSINENQSENWMISINVTYENEFDR